MDRVHSGIVDDEREMNAALDRMYRPDNNFYLGNISSRQQQRSSWSSIEWKTVCWRIGTSSGQRADKRTERGKAVRLQQMVPRDCTGNQWPYHLAPGRFHTNNCGCTWNRYSVGVSVERPPGRGALSKSDGGGRNRDLVCEPSAAFSRLLGTVELESSREPDKGRRTIYRGTGGQGNTVRTDGSLRAPVDSLWPPVQLLCRSGPFDL